MPTKKCVFCGTTTKDNYNLGEMLKAGKYKAHYFCVLLSAEITQSGEDNEGMLGFVESDLQKELKKNKLTKCIYCDTGNATLQCFNKKCNASFHLPCGLKNTCRLNFANFSTFCHTHSKILKDVKEPESPEKQSCIVCFEDIVDSEESLLLVCCRKHIHKLCAQKLAANAGYFTKCPNCNNIKKFVNLIQRNGVFVPQRDATWESDQAFVELEYQYDHCDAAVCHCPQGRSHQRGHKWMLIKCQYCGSSAVHFCCNQPKELYTCSVCDTIVKEEPVNSVDYPCVSLIIEPIAGPSGQSSTEADAKRRYSDEDEDDESSKKMKEM